MNLRWPLVGSIAALVAGIFVAALVVAFCGDNGEGPEGPTARATPRATRTVLPGRVTRTPRAGTPGAAAVLTMEPVAYQVKGEFAGLRPSLGRRLGVIDVREAYSASPPLPGQRLPGPT